MYGSTEFSTTIMYKMPNQVSFKNEPELELDVIAIETNIIVVNANITSNKIKYSNSYDRLFVSSYLEKINLLNDKISMARTVKNAEEWFCDLQEIYDVFVAYIFENSLNV